MKEYPIFVPLGEDHLAAVLTLPDDPARALIFLIQGGGGSSRSFYNSVWTVLARQLADRGFAALRMDFRGEGDSTGRFFMSMEELSVDEAQAVLDVALRATGVQRLGIAGICGGGVIALALAEQLGARCQSVAVIKLMIYGKKRIMPKDRRSRPLGQRVRAFAARHPSLDRLLRRYFWRAQVRTASPVVEQIARVRRRMPVLLMGYKAEYKLEAVMAAVQRRYGIEPVEIEDMPLAGPLGIQNRIGYQAFAVEHLLDWFERTLPRGVEEPASPGAPGGRESVTTDP